MEKGEITNFEIPQCFPKDFFFSVLKVALQIRGGKFYKSTTKIILMLPKSFNFHS